ncbi:hypothetical protein [Halalkalibacter sp. APA_J-10(15)]|nr:hypothetical protein [Halalkalibacter sp. APA_J-10(15)]
MSPSHSDQFLLLLANIRLDVTLTNQQLLLVFRNQLMGFNP